MPLLLPYFKFNVQDWLTSEKVGQMTYAQCGAYIKLLCLCWANQTCTLPYNIKALQSLIQWNDEELALRPVFNCFSPLKKGSDRCTNPRLYTEWQAAHALLVKQSAGGVKGARTRWRNATLRIPTPNTAPDWMAALRANPIYAHVNFERELGKIDEWKSRPANKHRNINQRFVANWLNKIEPPLSNGSALSCPHHPTLTFAAPLDKKKHDQLYHPKYEG